MSLFGLLIPWGSANNDPTPKFPGSYIFINNTEEVDYDRAWM